MGVVIAALVALGATAMAPAASAVEGLGGDVHYASDVDWVSATNGWGPVELDYNNGAKAVPDADRSIQSIRGTKYPKGLGTHAPASIVYSLGGDCRQLLGYVGIDDSQSGKGRVDFVVTVDGAEEFRMERTGSGPAGRLNLDVTGADLIELRAETGPEGNGNDHADWADLRFNCTDSFIAQPLTITPQDTDLSLLSPGSTAKVAVEGVLPQAPVTVTFAEVTVTANADEDGRATATFVVPAGIAGGDYEISATGEAKFGVTATGQAPAHVVAVSEAVHHIDCSAEGEGDGSVASPYTSLAQLTAAVGTFQPGEKVLFRRGAECAGTFAPKGSGLDTAPITVAPYGDGDEEATIDGAGALAGIHLLNVSNWTVDGMHVINPGTPDQRRVGILYEINDGSKRSGVVLTRNHVEKVAGWSDKTSLGNAFSRSAGISVLGDGVGWFDGITVTDNVINDTAAGGIKLSAPDSTAHYNEDVYVARNDIRAVGGDGIVIHNSDRPVIEYNSAIDLGHGEYPFLKGNFAGMWPYNSVDPLFQYNVVGNSVGSTYDSTAWDCDMKIKGSCTFQYNYSYGNAGGFYLDCISGCGTASTTTNTILRYNVSQDDCRLAGSSGGPGLHLIYNNTFSCLNRPFEDDMNAPREVRNNIIIAQGGTLKTANAVYESNAYFGGIQPAAGEADAIVGDPQLIAAGSGQTTRTLPGYRLAVGSPLLGAGTPIEDAGERDFFGDPIPATPNIGAYQGPGVAAAPLPFRELVNQTAVASAANPRNGAVTADLRAFSAEALADAGLAVGEKVSAFGAELDWHPNAVGTPDAVKAAGQQLKLEGEGDQLVVAGFSAGTQTEGTATVHYQDGTTQRVRIALPLWSDRAATAADTEVLADAASSLQRTKPYNGGTIQNVQERASIFAQRIPLSGKPVASVTLPAGSPVTGSGLSLFAVELAQSDGLDLAPTVTPRCLAGKAYVYVSVRNDDDVPVDIDLDTPYGARSFAAVEPGASATAGFNSRLAELPAGEVGVHATAGTAEHDGRAPYGALSCR
ncbi:NPCBM/NEW2 domain-containing protein [Microbacterium sp. KUDC0406]|uniref:NPCBM/NEW2 domain-containing protein n=1 Tax=Microbacterium sp. KUDC0406 TaxID=2909588 RepID=UPI001F3E1687|nr:NPCBM/NEW2 domain-containing protein [Microbacterium sp. KUDC0406]UJP08789.1 NPCBM/NEW2 domain-containing protein [Microbacterium sp. KUDC0406]